MLCTSLFCGAKVRPFYEVAKDFNKKQHIIPVYRTIFLNRRAIMHAMKAKNLRLHKIEVAPVARPQSTYYI